MPGSLETLHYHVGDDPDTGPETRARSADSFRASPPPGARGPAGADGAAGGAGDFFTSNEAAARFFLDRLLDGDRRPAMRSVTEPDRPERVPGLVVVGEQDVRALGTHQVRFAQTHEGIPIFGANAVVELTGDRDLVSVNAQLDEVAGVDATESLSRTDALERVAGYTGTELSPDVATGATLYFYKDDDTGSWHLAWLLADVPAAPPEDGPAGPAAADGPGDEAPVPDVGLGPRPTPPAFNYLVDAHDGSILFHYSAAPTAAAQTGATTTHAGPSLGTMAPSAGAAEAEVDAAGAAPLPIPARCKGIDENGDEQMFFGRLASPTGTACLLDDPLRGVRTYDLGGADIDSDPQLPAKAVEATSSDYGTTNRAAVSAHVNASRVQDFYKVVLQRDGIDDNGMDLISQVNVTAASMEPPPTLLNAFWWQKRMWYGQIMRDGRLVSLSRYLDVIGHELTHGVIETTSNLVYATQSGALNESFADIAGVIINNWYTAQEPKNVDTWDWEIGAGLRPDGRPLRNFADPTLTGHPAHMRNFRGLRPGERPSNANDQGWVHFNSNIHNKAVHNLLTATKDGKKVFTVEDVAVLTYLGMARLTPLAKFTDALQSVLDVAQSYFGGDTDKAGKLAAIRDAYALVGIEL